MNFIQWVLALGNSLLLRHPPFARKKKEGSAMGGGQSSIKESVFKDPQRLSNQEADTRGVNKTLEQVKEKLKRANPELKKSKNKLLDLAENLCDTDKLIQTYFSHLLERGYAALRTVEDEQVCFQKEGYRNEITRTRSCERMAADIDPLTKLEVKLLLFELRDQTLAQQLARYVHGHFHEFEFGPFHAAIQIGDVVLEWGPTGLIIPTRIYEPLHKDRPDSRAPIFVGNVHDKSDKHDIGLSDIPVRGGAESTQQGFEKIIENLKEVSTEKEQLIRELAEVVVRYNTKFEYGLLSNNCQHFVLDVLQVLCITEHEKAFEGRLKQHAAVLIARDKKSKDIAAEYNSHEELDHHLRGSINTLPPDELEFAYCHYLLFHAWGRKMPSEKAWQCDKEKCMCDVVHQRLEGQM